MRLMLLAFLLFAFGCGPVNDSNGNDNSFKDASTRPRSSEEDPQLAEGMLSRDCLLNRDPALWSTLHLNAHQIEQVEELRDRMLREANDTANVGARRPEYVQKGTNGEDTATRREHPVIATTGEGSVRNARTGKEGRSASVPDDGAYDQQYMVDELKRFLSSEQLADWRSRCATANEGHSR